MASLHSTDNLHQEAPLSHLRIERQEGLRTFHIYLYRHKIYAWTFINIVATTWIPFFSLAIRSSVSPSIGTLVPPFDCCKAGSPLSNTNARRVTQGLFFSDEVSNWFWLGLDYEFKHHHVFFWSLRSSRRHGWIHFARDSGLGNYSGGDITHHQDQHPLIEAVF